MAFDSYFKKRAKLLVKYGFVKDIDDRGNSVKKKYVLDKAKGYFVNAETGKEDYDPNDADEEYAEEYNLLPANVGSPSEYRPSGYPRPVKRYRIKHQSFNKGMEANYFWLMDHCRTTIGFTRSWKVYDIFTATENSSFFGNAQQRLGIQQDRVQQYLATIGKMVKDLFQLVRELRILDEKLEPRAIWHDSKAADSTLKGEFIDLVENRGGQMNASSVYGLAQNLGYTTLPDLFFNTHITKLDKVDSEVAKLDYNENIKNVLKRKIYQYINWKEKTDHELKNRRVFTLKYLRQHWDVIQMYMAWIKPYLHHIKRLHMNEDQLDNNIDLVGAFEQSLIEVEVIFGVPTKKGVFDVAIMTFEYRTRPQMSYQQEGYNKGPLHMGQFEFHMRGYTMKEAHIKSYIKMRQEENFEMLTTVDKSVKAAMEALGDELQRYLNEAGEEYHVKKKEAPSKPKKATDNLFEPFTALFSGLGDVFSFGDLFKSGKKSKVIHPDWSSNVSAKGAIGSMWQVYKNFKGSMGWYKWG